MNPSIMGRMGICVYCGGPTHVVVGQVVDQDLERVPVTEGGKQVIIQGSKSTEIFALDPDHDGKIIWRTPLFGHGGGKKQQHENAAFTVILAQNILEDEYGNR